MVYTEKRHVQSYLQANNQVGDPAHEQGEADAMLDLTDWLLSEHFAGQLDCARLRTRLTLEALTFVSSSVSASRRRMTSKAGSDPPLPPLSEKPVSRGTMWPASDEEARPLFRSAAALSETAANLLSKPASQCKGLSTVSTYFKPV